MPQNETFSYPLLIREHHLDSFGHVNNATYLSIFEEARWEFVTARGFGLDRIQVLGVGPIVLEVQVKFLKEIVLRQSVIIESQLLSYEKKIGTMQQVIVDAAGQRYCEAHLTFGLFDMKQRRLILPQAEWLAAVGWVR